MNAKVEELAAEIAAMDDVEQKALLERAAELSFRRGLMELSELYRKRLGEQGKLDRAAKEILAELRQFRGEIAAGDYRR